MSQLHKRFSDDQVRMLFRGYCQGFLERANIVVASDGVNTSQDVSDAVFNVESKPPDASILYPQDGITSAPGSLLVLEGMATDLEDGPLTGDLQFTWSSSLDGELGIGRKLTTSDLVNG